MLYYLYCDQLVIDPPGVPADEDAAGTATATSDAADEEGSSASPRSPTLATNEGRASRTCTCVVAQPQRAAAARAQRLVALYSAADMLDLDRLAKLVQGRVLSDARSGNSGAAHRSPGGLTAAAHPSAAAAAVAAAATAPLTGEPTGAISVWAATAALAAMERFHVGGTFRQQLLRTVAGRLPEASVTCPFSCHLSRETIVELVSLAHMAAGGEGNATPTGATVFERAATQ